MTVWSRRSRTVTFCPLLSSALWAAARANCRLRWGLTLATDWIAVATHAPFALVCLLRRAAVSCQFHSTWNGQESQASGSGIQGIERSSQAIAATLLVPERLNRVQLAGPPGG